jgi:uncharacterized protein involved in type VI secretion and phage assembly
VDDLQRHAGKFYGKYSGEVTDNADTDFFGRIKVKVPAVFGADVDVRARPCFAAAHFFVPPIGEKVWVEFEAGDTRYPLWVGTWYPQGKSPTDAQISPPDNRVIQTPSGHTIQIMDKAGDEKIVIKHKGNSFVTIDKDGSILIGNQKGSLLALDSKNEHALLAEQHGNLILADKSGVTVKQKSGGTVLQMTDDTIVLGAANVILNGSVVCGDPLKPPFPLLMLDPATLSMLTAFFMGHVHATALGPSGPPTPPGPTLAPGAGQSSTVSAQ